MRFKSSHPDSEDEQMDIEQQLQDADRETSPPAPPRDYEDIVDPELVVEPVLPLIAPALQNAWAINKKNKMSLIFDVVNPVRTFKRGAKYDEEAEDPYTDYDPNQEEDPNVTETDEGDAQPYNPAHYR